MCFPLAGVSGSSHREWLLLLLLSSVVVVVMVVVVATYKLFKKRGTYQFVSREAPTEDDENSPNCLINQNYVEIDVNIADLAKD